MDNAIDGQELLYLTHHVLEIKLGVGRCLFCLQHWMFGFVKQPDHIFFAVPFGHRNRIMRGISLLKNPSASAYLQVDVDDSSIPEEYFCPITQQLMKDPVIAAGQCSLSSQLFGFHVSSH